MSEHIHLQAGLLGIHGLYRDALGADDLDLILVLFGLLDIILGRKARGLIFVDKLFAVTQQLALESLLGHIDGIVHTGGPALGADDAASERNGDLYPLKLALSGEHYMRGGFLREEFSELFADLFLDGILVVLSESDVVFFVSK